MMYKITFNMTSPIAFTNLPVFDSIISYCVYRERLYSKANASTPHATEVLNTIDIFAPYCINKDNQFGFYRASFMLFDKEVESVEKWRKRWENKFDYLADFGKSKRRINTGSGKFKSYDIPIVIHSIKKVWFYFDGDADEVERLIKKYIVGFGKKTAIGYGMFSDFKIEKAQKEDEKWLYYRPLPLDHTLTMKVLEYGFKIVANSNTRSYSPPYWLEKPGEKKAFIPCISNQEKFLINIRKNKRTENNNSNRRDVRKDKTKRKKVGIFF